jgi:hypothetical protein
VLGTQQSLKNSPSELVAAAHAHERRRKYETGFGLTSSFDLKIGRASCTAQLFLRRMFMPTIFQPPSFEITHNVSPTPAVWILF